MFCFAFRLGAGLASAGPGPATGRLTVVRPLVVAARIQAISFTSNPRS